MSALSHIYGEVRDLPLAAPIAAVATGEPFRQYICDAVAKINQLSR